MKQDIFSWIRNRPVTHTFGTSAISGPCNVEDDALVARIVAAYRLAAATDVGDESSGWVTSIGKLKGKCHATLVSGTIDEQKMFLRNPGNSVLHYGFDEQYDHTGLEDHSLTQLASSPDWLYDLLRRLGEAMGTIRLEYPEAYHLDWHKDFAPSVEEILARLDVQFGFRIDFPNCFPGEVGLETSRGVASFRAIQSLHQAWRLFELTNMRSSVSIVEIGGGLGKTAYYAWKLGMRDYTIVDLPMSNVAQANFLGRTLDGADIALFKEETEKEKIKIVPPSAFFCNSEMYDVGANFDSFTEMSKSTAIRYIEELTKRTGLLISVNHEINPFTVRELIDTLGLAKRARAPYWLRKGYVEEIISRA